MIVHVERPRELVDKLLKLIRGHQGCWLQAQHIKSVVCFTIITTESIIEKEATLNSNKNYNDLGINKPNKDV